MERPCAMYAKGCHLDGSVLLLSHLYIRKQASLKKCVYMMWLKTHFGVSWNVEEIASLRTSVDHNFDDDVFIKVVLLF